MIDKILILSCDRPEYLKITLDSVVCLGIPVEVFVDKPNTQGRIEAHKEVLNLLKTYKGVKARVNTKHYGCTKSMHNMIDNRGEGNTFLFLEDDISLNEGALKEIYNIIEGKDNEAYVLKLNAYFWGWVSNNKTLKLMNEVRTGSALDDKYKGDSYYQSLKIFYKEGVHLIWDEVYQGCLKYCDIQEIKVPEPLTNHFGTISSRFANPQDKQAATYTLFIDGEFKEMKQI